jgi:hypothetical protein
MLTLPEDLILKFAEPLSDKDKMAISMSSKILDQLKYKFTYHNEMLIDRISKLPYFDNFEHIMIIYSKNIYPKKVKYVHFVTQTTSIPPQVTHLTFSSEFNRSIKNVIPMSVTHLTFGFSFNQPIKDCIPSSVTHLTFGACFNQSIHNSIPPFVTHLTFCSDFNQPINDCIPCSVTHLTFGYSFNQSIKDCILSSVTHLTFGFRFNQRIDKYIPLSVTHLTFGWSFDHPIKEIPTSVEEIIIPENYKMEKIDEKIKSQVEIKKRR